MDRFTCYYCDFGASDFKIIIDHTSKCHTNDYLKIRSLELNLESGKLGYRTHDFNILPSSVSRNSRIEVKSDDPGNLCIRVISDEEKSSLNQANVFRSPLAKKVKKADDSEKQCSDETQIECDLDIMEIDDSFEQENEDETALIKLVPDVLKTLKKYGFVDIWQNFNTLLSRDEFPMDNIAFLLFADVVKWYSNDNSVSMRYDEKVSKFWRVGYKLFHGKFLRFMGGPKHKGHIIFGESSRGYYSPWSAQMNFAVPMRKVTHTNAAPLPPKDIKPGIIRYLLDKVSQAVTEDKTYKLCFDGKKINSSTSGDLGDVDLFGFEQEPTLSQRQNRLQNELQICRSAIVTLEDLLPCQNINSLLPSITRNICNKIVSIIKLLGCRLKELRTLKTSKMATLAKFKGIAGTNWKKSKLCMVISAISTQVYDIDICINTILQSIKKLGYAVAIMNNACDHFSLDRIVVLKDQGNYQHLNEIREHTFEENEFRVMKQRSDQWFAAREKSIVTGSTLNAALGLDTLKKQQEHYDFVKFRKQKTTPSPKVQEKMNHGSSNEINAIATIVARIIPVLFPDLAFSEEGCVKINREGTNIIVSPDGSLFNISSKETQMAIEIKCPFPPSPDSYKVPVFYKIPLYYVPQILSEMFALGTGTLMFACYSCDSTTIMQAKFDQELWEIIEHEIQTVYGPNASRPTKKSDTVHILKKKMGEYVESHVEFLGEFASVKAEDCPARQSSISEPYCTHQSTKKDNPDVIVGELIAILYEVEKSLHLAYKLNRMKATEFLGFMISDLDRMFTFSGITSVPVAFGMQGYSLSTETLRKIVEYILVECAKVGLYIPVCSFDGQWARLTVRDRHNLPLTVRQLQKDVFQDVKTMSQSQLVSGIVQRNVVKCLSNASLIETVEFETNTKGRLIVKGKREKDVLSMSQTVLKLILRWKEGKLKQINQSEIEKEPTVISEAFSDILPDVIETVPENIMTDVLISNCSTTEGIQIQNTSDLIDISDVFNTPESEVTQYKLQLQTTDEEPDEHVEELNSTVIKQTHEQSSRMEEDTEELLQLSDVENNVKKNILNEKDVSEMHEALKNNLQTKKNWIMSQNEFAGKFVNAETINTCFTRNELIVAINPVLGKLACSGIKIGKSTTKRNIIVKLSEILGDGSLLPAANRARRKSPPSLSILTKKAIVNLPKLILCAITAEAVFAQRLESWYYSNPFGKLINVDGLPHLSTCNYFSMPEFNDCTGNYIFMILDSYHQLCGLRRLVCQTGIPAKGVNRKAFIEIAQENETNGCGLNMAMVDDLIDKQNAEFARATFSDKVSSALDVKGYCTEATFCRLVNNWYRADDDPGISALDRCKFRLEFREWLLDGAFFSEFPPCGSHIKDIPQVLFEGLITNIERKIQLYTFTKSGTYNVRSVGSLDIENFYGTFQDIDPKGRGVLNPDDIPTAISVATELLDAKLDPNRGFHMDTTRSKVYPTKSTLNESNDSTTSNCSPSSGIWRDLTTISPQDHEFDMKSRVRGKAKRKSAGVSQPDKPARGCLPVRQYHRCDESKIMPHVRRGLNL